MGCYIMGCDVLGCDVTGCYITGCDVTGHMIPHCALVSVQKSVRGSVNHFH